MDGRFSHIAFLVRLDDAPFRQVTVGTRSWVTLAVQHVGRGRWWPGTVWFTRGSLPRRNKDRLCSVVFGDLRRSLLSVIL